MKVISTFLIILSLSASVYYLFVGLIKPEILLVYNKAGIPHWGIQLWALILGISGILLVFPLTFKTAATFMILNSLFTLTCFVVTRDWRGGLLEFIFLQIPIFLLWVGYSLSVLEKLKRYIA